MKFVARGALAVTAMIVALGHGPSPASAGVGQPSPQGIGMQEPVTQIGREILAFHNWVTWIIAVITLFVLALLIWVMVRYNERANPTPKTFTHNTLVEIVWTVVPVLILLVIAVPSFRLLYDQYTYPKPDVTIKATGNTWMWVHDYPDLGISIDSNMVTDEDVVKASMSADEYKKRFSGLDELTLTKALYDEAKSKQLWEKRGEPRQLAVDNEIAVPVGKVVHVLVTSSSVIHGWNIPSFGAKTQAVPGRITSTWFKADRVGVYYGQCSVLCGKLHSSMPIAVRVVPQQAFDDWVAAVKAKDEKKAKAILKAATSDPSAPKFAAAQN